MKKKIFTFLSIISVLFLNFIDVSAFSFSSLIGTGGLLKYTYDNLCLDSSCLNNTNIAIPEYDSSVSLFDKYGYDLNLISNCDTTYYYDNSTSNIVTSTNNSKVKLCDSNSGVSLSNVKKLFKYYISIVWTDKITGTQYNTYLVFVNQPYVKKYLDRDIIKSKLVDYNGNDNLQGLIISNVYCFDSIHTDSENNTSYFTEHINGNYYTGFTHLSGYLDSLQCSTNDDEHLIRSFNNVKYDLFNLLNYNAPYIDIKAYTNFDLTYFESNENYINASNGFLFDTDRDLNIKYNEYAILIPKYNSAFSSYLWTDSNFVFDVSNYDTLGSYTPLQQAGLDEISFQYLNGFNWFRWDFSFSSDDLLNHKLLFIYNHNENRELNIKYFSSDFEVRLMNKDSSSFIYNGISYSNNWEDLNNLASQHIIKNQFTFDVVNNSTSYINNLPNLIKTFSSAFVFIGSLITSAFSIFSSEMLVYFYVIFGIMLIMLIITIMK